FSHSAMSACGHHDACTDAAVVCGHAPTSMNTRQSKIAQARHSGQYWCPYDKRRAVPDLAFFCIMGRGCSSSIVAPPPIVRRRGSANLRISGSTGTEARGSVMATTKDNLQSLRNEFDALTTEVTRLIEASDQHGAGELKKRIGEVRAKFESTVSEVSDGSYD